MDWINRMHMIDPPDLFRERSPERSHPANFLSWKGDVSPFLLGETQPLRWMFLGVQGRFITKPCWIEGVCRCVHPTEGDQRWCAVGNSRGQSSKPPEELEAGSMANSCFTHVLLNCTPTTIIGYTNYGPKFEKKNNKTHQRRSDLILGRTLSFR